jgi:gelsolin
MMLLRDGESKPKGDVPAGTPEMFKISDADGTIGMDAVDYGKDSLNGDDVFVINNGNHCFCWVGSGASIDERRNAMSYACNYLNKTATPWLPITVVAEGNEPAGFEF